MSETEETENNSISEPEEVVPFLVKDEEEAIAGYDEATEVIQDSEIKNKEEILDTLDHIKEEEKEHIEELQDLEVDTNTKDENDPISNPEEIETPEDDIAELKELFDVGLNVGIDGGENNNVSVLSSHEPEKEGEEELKELFDANVNLSLDGGTGNDVSVLSPLGGVGLGEGKKSTDKELHEHVNEEHSAIESTQELEGTDNAVVKCKVAKVVTHSEDEKPVDCEGKKTTKVVTEGYQKFTPEEMEEYGIDEDGNSIEGYDEYVRCTWCEDIFTKDDCGFEADLGWLCDRCQMAISSRGERLSMVINPTEDDFKRVMNEDIPMTSDELMNKYGTDDIDLINAGKESEERVELKEEAPEYDLTEVNKLLKEIRGENKKKSIHMR
jgi:rubrerythrin